MSRGGWEGGGGVSTGVWQQEKGAGEGWVREGGWEG